MFVNFLTHLCIFFPSWVSRKLFFSQFYPGLTPQIINGLPPRSFIVLLMEGNQWHTLTQKHNPNPKKVSKIESCFLSLKLSFHVFTLTMYIDWGFYFLCSWRGWLQNLQQSFKGGTTGTTIHNQTSTKQELKITMDCKQVLGLC